MGNQNPLIGGLNGLCCNCAPCPFLYAIEVTSVTSSKSLIKTFYLDSFCHTVNDISASFQLTLKLSKITFQSFCCSAMRLGKCIALTFVTCDALTTRLWGLQKPLFKSNFLESFGFWPCQRPSRGDTAGSGRKVFPEFPVWLTLINRPSTVLAFSVLFLTQTSNFLESFISMSAHLSSSDIYTFWQACLGNRCVKEYYTYLATASKKHRCPEQQGSGRNIFEFSLVWQYPNCYCFQNWKRILKLFPWGVWVSLTFKIFTFKKSDFNGIFVFQIRQTVWHWLS